MDQINNESIQTGRTIEKRKEMMAGLKMEDIRHAYFTMRTTEALTVGARFCSSGMGVIG